MLKRLLILSALALTAGVQASPVFKCVDAAGAVTFTQNRNCPQQGAVADIADYRNASPSGSGPAVRMAKAAPPAVASKRTGQAFTVVGAPPIVAAAPVPVAPPPVVVHHGRSNQPCIKTVEKMFRSSRIAANGQRVGRAEIRKVLVPC